jgi:flavin reductase (DIM6/NTAB) family NADH-FMN oxidoreductase RutF
VTSIASPPAIAAAARTPDFTALEFRAALGMFATGVTVVTARLPDGRPVGLTASSFNTVSLAPPLVLWSLAQSSSSMPAFAAGAHYAIHVLAADQLDLALQFAQRGIDRFAGLAHAPGIAGAPILAGAAAVFECFSRSRYAEGDHTIFVGEVERCSHRPGASPLLYHGGQFYTEHPVGAPLPADLDPRGALA